MPEKKKAPRILIALGGLVALAAIVWAAMFFQPWKAFIDDVVNEDFPALSDQPTQTPPTGGDGGQAPAPEGEGEPTGPQALAVGVFQPLDHPAQGGVVAYELPDGSRVLRLEELRTDNGPDLFVYLTNTGVGGPVGEGINLGALKGNIGSQNYDIPAGVDLAAYDTVVIWCRQFDSSFGAAPLEPAGT